MCSRNHFSLVQRSMVVNRAGKCRKLGANWWAFVSSNHIVSTIPGTDPKCQATIWMTWNFATPGNKDHVRARTSDCTINSLQCAKRINGKLSPAKFMLHRHLCNLHHSCAFQTYTKTSVNLYEGKFGKKGALSEIKIHFWKMVQLQCNVFEISYWLESWKIWNRRWQ